jgi:SAM-dependent methyltransferase
MFGLKARLERRLPPSTYLLLRQIRVELTAVYFAPIQKRKIASLPRSGLRIELGSGHIQRAGWVDVDLLNPSANLRLDLRRPLPFADGSADEIHSEHLFEHLEYLEALALMAECRRVIRPGGTLSIGVPDPGPALRAYVNGDRTFFKRDGSRSTEVTKEPCAPSTSEGAHWAPPSWVVTPMQHLNFLFHQFGDHRFIYDAETLVASLTQTGFVRAHERAFDTERDSMTRRDGTLYVDAIRPPDRLPGTVAPAGSINGDRNQ